VRIELTAQITEHRQINRFHMCLKWHVSVDEVLFEGTFQEALCRKKLFLNKILSMESALRICRERLTVSSSNKEQLSNVVH